MKSKGTVNKLLLILLLFFNSLSGFSQSSGLDSILGNRMQLVSTYDSLRKASLEDTVTIKDKVILKAANDLINYDNDLVTQEIQKILQSTDSLQKANAMSESGFQNLNHKIKRLYANLLITAVAGVAGLILFIVFLIAWLNRRKNINRLNLQQGETERVLAEYRKRLNELQSDLDNSRTQTKTLINENTLLEKEVSRLADENQDARDAGYLSEHGHIPYPEQIKNLEDQLMLENTRKKILEQEILDILRKLRGED
jgi:hypothetical protein